MDGIRRRKLLLPRPRWDRPEAYGRGAKCLEAGRRQSVEGNRVRREPQSMWPTRLSALAGDPVPARVHRSAGRDVAHLGNGEQRAARLHGRARSSACRRAISAVLRRLDRFLGWAEAGHPHQSVDGALDGAQSAHAERQDGDGRSLAERQRDDDQGRRLDFRSRALHRALVRPAALHEGAERGQESSRPLLELQREPEQRRRQDVEREHQLQGFHVRRQAEGACEMIRRIASCVALTLVFTAPLRLEAHHSAVMFDDQKEVTVEGTVKEFQYTNPHSWLLVDVTNKDGSVTTWGFEAEGPTTLQRAGIKPSEFPAGTKVTMTGRPMENGTPAATWELAVRDDGKEFYPAGR